MRDVEPGANVVTGALGAASVLGVTLVGNLAVESESDALDLASDSISTVQRIGRATIVARRSTQKHDRETK